MKTISLETTKGNLEKLQNLIEKEMEGESYDEKKLLKLQMAVEEVYVNIVNYAYESDAGLVAVTWEKRENPLRLWIEFRDGGTPFDPLQEPNVDITLGAEERKIGGLGIFLVKKMVDQISYQYHKGQNVLAMEKIMK